MGGGGACCGVTEGPDSPVYDVTSESKKKIPRTLHRNMLLPCDHLPSESAVPVDRQRRVQDRLPARDTPSSISSFDDENEFPSFSQRPQAQLTEDIAEYEENPPNAGQSVQLQSKTPGGEAPLAAVDDPTEELAEQAEPTLEEKNEDWPEITQCNQQTPQFRYHQPELQPYRIPIPTQYPWNVTYYPMFPRQQ